MKQLLTALFLTAIIGNAAAQDKCYWQQRVEYEMEIDMDVETWQYEGHQELKYTNNSPDELTHVYYHLFFNAFQPGSMMDVRSRTISDADQRVGDRIAGLSEDEIGFIRPASLKQDGKALDFEVQGTILKVPLAKPIKPGKS